MTDVETSPFLLLLRSRWWLLLVGVVPTLLVSLVRVAGAPVVYESTSTFVVRPVQADAERVMRAMDTLLRGVEINTTYASIVGSRLVSDRALERLDLSDEDRDGLSANGKVITGTSILEIRVSARTPEVAHDFAEEVAAETLSYINELENGFGLVPLDAPTRPRSTAGPGKGVTLVLSLVLGTVLGLGLVFASGQLFPLGGRRRFDIIDPVTGASTKEYFLQRLREEVARIDRSGGALTVALLVPATVRSVGRFLPDLLGGPDLQRVVAVVRGELHDADVLAYLGRGRFAILALDRIAPELGAQLRAADPSCAVQVSETTYVGGTDGEGGTTDDLATFLQRLEDGLSRTAESDPTWRDEPRQPMWSGPR
jgi:capsular polysaccharide biosynthesis protein